MTDHELLEWADNYLGPHKITGVEPRWKGSVQDLVDQLAAALRTALATPAEPLFEGELFEFTGDGRAAMIRRVDASSWPFVARKGLRNTRVVVYVANPAAPEEDT